MSRADLYIWDVGQGASLYVQTPNQQNIVIDCGASDSFSPAQYIRACNINQIDNLIVSHPHEDHINDILNIEECYWRRSCLFALTKNNAITKELMIESNPDLKNNAYIDKYFDMASNFTYTPSAQTNWGCDILYRTNSYVSGNNINNKTINNLSLVTFIGVGADVVLYGGDMEKEGWEQIMKDVEFVRWLKKTTIYIASHHGNESGYYSEMFKLFTPKITVIPAGKKPEHDATNKYCDKTSGINVYKAGSWKQRKVLTTRNDGNIHITLSNDNVEPVVALG